MDLHGASSPCFTARPRPATCSLVCPRPPPAPCRPRVLSSASTGRARAPTKGGGARQPSHRGELEEGRADTSGLGGEASNLEPTGDSPAAGRVLDLDGGTEQVPERPESPKQWKAKAGVNLRKNLAWDNTFFTSEATGCLFI